MAYAARYHRALSRKLAGEPLPDTDNVLQLLRSCRRKHRKGVAESTARAFQLFLSPIPADVRRAVGQFGERQWHVLSLVARCQGALELAASAPAVAFLLASPWVFASPVSKPLRLAQRLVLKKRRHVLGYFGFPATQAAVNVFNKIAARSVSARQLLHLRRCMSDSGVMKILAHLPRLNASVLWMVTDERLRSRVSPRLMEAVISRQREDGRVRLAFLIRDSLDMAVICRPGWRFPILRSVEQIEEVHDELVAEMEQLGPEAVRNVSLPKPPVPGTADIIPLDSAKELLEEGSEQHNCVGSYVNRVLDGHTFVYRMLAPERATLSIVRRGSGWALSQIAATCNRAIGQAAWQVAKEWLEGVGLSETVS